MQMSNQLQFCGIFGDVCTEYATAGVAGSEVEDVAVSGRYGWPGLDPEHVVAWDAGV